MPVVQRVPASNALADERKSGGCSGADDIAHPDAGRPGRLNHACAYAGIASNTAGTSIAMWRAPIAFVAAIPQAGWKLTKRNGRTGSAIARSMNPDRTDVVSRLKRLS
jgi:hypothetical protein